MKMLLLAVIAILAVGCSPAGVAPNNAPPAGVVWFGEAFDPATFAISGKTTAVLEGESAVMVANVGRAVTSGDLVLRTTLDGTVVGTQPMAGEGEGEIWGLQLNPMTPGEWTYELVDIGNNVLASGTLTVP